MNTLIACLVLAAGTVLQPGGGGGTPPAQPANGQPVEGFEIDLGDAELLNFKDPSLIPSWATKPENRNAALGYLTAQSNLPKLLSDAISEIEWDKVPTSGEAPEAFTKAAKILRDAGEQAIEDCLAASSREKCDFELSYEGGVSMLMPHLGMTRNLARVLRFDARDQLLQGHADKAAQRVAALFRMGRHVTNDRILISTLVGYSISTLATQEARVLVNSGKLSPADVALLRGAIANIVKDDPFNGKASLVMERDLFLKWFEVAISRGDATAKAAVAMYSDSETKSHLKGLKGESLTREIGLAREGYDEIIAAWGTPDTTAKLIAINARLEKGEFGVIARVAMPAFTKAWTNVEKQLKDLAELDALLAAIAK
jgi:hypothetical protein